MSVWDDKQTLDKLEQQRANKRAVGQRLAFDCFNLKCRGDRAHCSKGRLLGSAADGSLALVVVLRGVTSGTCKYCKDFVTDRRDYE